MRAKRAGSIGMGRTLTPFAATAREESSTRLVIVAGSTGGGVADTWDPMEMEDDAARAIDGLRRVVHGLRASAHVAEREVSLSGAQLFVLRELAAEPDVSIRRLAERTLTDPSSVSVVVARLEERGLVRRRRDEDDARRSVLALSKRGAALLARAPEPYQARIVAALRRMPKAEVRRLADVLAKLIDAAGPTSARAPLFFEDGARKKGASKRVPRG